MNPTRIYFSLTPFLVPAKAADLPFRGSVVNGAIVPDDWSGIMKLPNWSIGGDGITPVNKASVLSFQPGMGLQARVEGTAGLWEVVSFFGGGYFAVDPDGGTLQGPYAFVAVA